MDDDSGSMTPGALYGIMTQVVALVLSSIRDDSSVQPVPLDRSP